MHHTGAIIIAAVAVVIIGALVLFMRRRPTASPPDPNKDLANAVTTHHRAYAVTKDHDIDPGSNLFALSATNFDVAGCEAMCDDTRGCVGFSWNGAGCWGKSATTPLVPNPSVDAYIAATTSVS